ncbi:hypothetical protein B0J12DRAFT_763352 [Macrophomina phaseolina]|uniref:Uncharacterized protein n=1 Tax=Macrophomina phaseolina TaxID=35725 RepID=A0ABQ8GPZ9_9PEZI|nr:hypothetical protein B0J12DRAFT_763352 [Macrophomina phaseolina]
MAIRNRIRHEMAQHPRAAKKKRVAGKKRLGFLDLPGEIRNEIYAYCFEEEIWVDMTPNANHVLKQTKIQAGTWASAALYTAFRPVANAPKDDTNATTDATSIAIASAATTSGTTTTQHQHTTLATTPATKFKGPAHPRRKPHKIEYHPQPRGRKARIAMTTPGRPTLPFFYATPFFIFSAPNALLAFLRLLPAPKLALIRKAHIAYATYGDPYASADAEWKARSERTWARAMREASEKLVGLAVLRVRVVVNERPLVFGFGEPWAKALMVWAAACQREVDVDPRTGRPSPGALAPLRMEIGVQSAFVMRKARMPEDALRGALVELHQLFAEAVRRKLCGWSEQDAMIEFRLTKFEKYKRLAERYPLP